MPSATIAPSILAADFARLGEEAAKVANADWLHVDVMDGRFVHNISFGPAIVHALSQSTKLPLDVHLMIVEPERYLADFVNAGAASITLHAEATAHLHRAVQLIRGHGVRAGVALNPATPLDAIEYVLGDIDILLLMTVNPGFGGQAFIPAVLPKIAEASQRIKSHSSRARIEVDGGIDPDTAIGCAQAGAEIFVAGSAIFGHSDPAARIDAFRTTLENI